MRNRPTLGIAGSAMLGLSTSLLAQGPSAPPAEDDAPTNSLMAQAVQREVRGPGVTERHALRDASLFAIVPPKPREFRVHDLVQIIVRETSRAKSKSELETDKSYELDGKVSAWPDFGLSDLANLQILAGRTTNLPKLGLDVEKSFTGEGEYKREDDLTARLTAEVIEILPNGNLVLEARTSIRTDGEVATMKVTGICRHEDVTAANSILSNLLHDLTIEKMHEGELRKSSEKGIIAKVLDAIFAF